MSKNTKKVRWKRRRKTCVYVIRTNMKNEIKIKCRGVCAIDISAAGAGRLARERSGAPRHHEMSTTKMNKICIKSYILHWKYARLILIRENLLIRIKFWEERSKRKRHLVHRTCIKRDSLSRLGTVWSWLRFIYSRIQLELIMKKKFLFFRALNTFWWSVYSIEHNNQMQIAHFQR